MNEAIRSAEVAVELGCDRFGSPTRTDRGFTGRCDDEAVEEDTGGTVVGSDLLATLSEPPLSRKDCEGARSSGGNWLRVLDASGPDGLGERVRVGWSALCNAPRSPLADDAGPLALWADEGVLAAGPARGGCQYLQCGW